MSGIDNDIKVHNRKVGLSNVGEFSKQDSLGSNVNDNKSDMNSNSDVNVAVNNSNNIKKSNSKDTIDDDSLILVFVGALLIGLFVLYIVISNAPNSSSADGCYDYMGIIWLVKAFFPKWIGGRGDVISTVIELHKCTVSYNSLYPSWTIIIYISTYILLQAFAIPGPLILSIISGSLWDAPTAILLITFSATTGASTCYLLSRSLKLGRLAKRFSPENYEKFREKIANNKDNIWFYMLFLRLTPFLPNWFINLTSPIAGIPFATFASATMLGLIPANILHYFTGKNLANMEPGENIFQNNGRNFAILFCLQFVALLPVMLKSKLAKIEQKSF